MTHQTSDGETNQRHDRCVSLHLTPAEWRRFLEDSSFLSHQDNRYQPPRRLMGVAVEIVPGHEFG